MKVSENKIIKPESNSTDSNPEPAASESLITHLIELRNRLLVSLASVLVVFIALVYFSNDIYVFLATPLIALLPEGSTMIATGITSPFFAPFKLTLVLSLILSIPIVLHQIWSFISPGLYQHEKKFAIPLLASSILLFYAGIAFAYYAVFPLMLAFFTSIGPEHVAIMPDISQFLDIALKLFLAFGVAFEIPIATLLLVWSGITTVESLASKRSYVIVGCFIVGMLLTPPDVISQVLLAVPMWTLFELGLLFSRLIQKREAEDIADE